MNSLEGEIRNDLVAAHTKALGYDFDADRVERIGGLLTEYMDRGLPAANAAAEALHDDLLLHGDPLAPSLELRGVVNS